MTASRSSSNRTRLLRKNGALQAELVAYKAFYKKMLKVAQFYDGMIVRLKQLESLLEAFATRLDEHSQQLQAQERHAQAPFSFMQVFARTVYATEHRQPRRPWVRTACR